MLTMNSPTRVHVFCASQFYADPQRVIALYPTLLPVETRTKVLENFPSSPPTLTGKEHEEALVVLAEYLNEVC